MPLPMTGSWAATRGRSRCPSPISPDSRPTAGSSTSDAAPARFIDGDPIGPFWDAAQALDPEVETGSVCPGRRVGHLADLFRAAGIRDIVDSAVAVDVEHATFEDWWEPFTLGVAPSGAHVAGLEPDQRTALRELCRERLPEPPFTVSAKAWVARGAA